MSDQSDDDPVTALPTTQELINAALAEDKAAMRPREMWHPRSHTFQTQEGSDHMVALLTRYRNRYRNIRQQAPFRYGPGPCSFLVLWEELETA